MRTAIIVYESSEISIETSEAINLEDMKGPLTPLTKLGSSVRFTLARGVYRVISTAQITVSIASIVKTEVDIMVGDIKDEVPQPRPQILPDQDPNSDASRKFTEAYKAFLSKEPENDEVTAARPRVVRRRLLGQQRAREK